MEDEDLGRLSAQYRRVHSSATKALFSYLDESHRNHLGQVGPFNLEDQKFRYASSTVLVQASFEVPVIVQYPGSTIEYSFHTGGEDIEFAVVFAVYPILTLEEEHRLRTSASSSPSTGSNTSDVLISDEQNAKRMDTVHSMTNSEPIEGKDMEFKTLFPMTLKTSDINTPIKDSFVVEEDGVLFFLFSNEYAWMGYKELTYTIEVQTPSFSQPDMERSSIAYTMLDELATATNTAYASLEANIALIHEQTQEIHSINKNIEELRELLHLKQKEQILLIDKEKQALQDIKIGLDRIPGIGIRMLSRPLLSRIFTFLSDQVHKQGLTCWYWRDIATNGNMYSDMGHPPKRMASNARLLLQSTTQTPHSSSDSNLAKAAGGTTSATLAITGGIASIGNNRLRVREPYWDRKKVKEVAVNTTGAALYTSPTKTNAFTTSTSPMPYRTSSSRINIPVGSPIKAIIPAAYPAAAMMSPIITAPSNDMNTSDKALNYNELDYMQLFGIPAAAGRSSFTADRHIRLEPVVLPLHPPSPPLTITNPITNVSIEEMKMDEPTRNAEASGQPVEQSTNEDKNLERLLRASLRLKSMNITENHSMDITSALSTAVVPLETPMPLPTTQMTSPVNGVESTLLTITLTD